MSLIIACLGVHKPTPKIRLPKVIWTVSILSQYSSPHISALYRSMGNTILSNNSQFIFTGKPPHCLLYIYNSPSAYLLERFKFFWPLTNLTLEWKLVLNIYTWKQLQFIFLYSTICQCFSQYHLFWKQLIQILSYLILVPKDRKTVQFYL